MLYLDLPVVLDSGILMSGGRGVGGCPGGLYLMICFSSVNISVAARVIP